MLSLTEHGSLSPETVRRRLAVNDLKPWQKKMWCIPKLDAEYVARMEDVPISTPKLRSPATGRRFRRKPDPARGRGPATHAIVYVLA